MCRNYNAGGKPVLRNGVPVGVVDSFDGECATVKLWANRYMKLEFDPDSHELMALEVASPGQGQNDVSLHDCRECKGFNTCLSIVGTGTMAKCIWWNELKEISKQIKGGERVADKWICTDPDSVQYCKKIDDFTWAYIESRECNSTDKQVVCHAVIDIRDYTLDELWQYCSGYYQSYEEMVEEYGFREALHIMAECVFEQLNFDDMEFNAEQKNLGESIKFIHEWTTC